MSGIYNVGQCVMTWSISNCEQGSGTCFFLQIQHQNVSFVMSNCEFVTFPLVSWVRCGT